MVWIPREMQRWADEEGIIICQRCGKEYMDPVPKAVHPDGNPEIATKDWCPDCNSFTMCLVFRGSTAYKIPKGTEVTR